MFLIFTSELFVIHLMQIVKRHYFLLKLWTLLILMKSWLNLLLKPLDLWILIKVWRLHIGTIFLVNYLKFFLLFHLLMHFLKMFSSFIIFIFLINYLILLVKNSFHFQVLNFLFDVRGILIGSIGVLCILAFVLT